MLLIVLTPREKEVLDLLVRGSDRQEIARELGISVGTVQTHQEHIRSAFGMGSMTAIAYSVGCGECEVSVVSMRRNWQTGRRVV